MEAFIAFLWDIEGLVLTAIGGAVAILLGWKIKSWIVEQQMEGNPEMEIGNEFWWIRCQSSGADLLGEGRVKSMEGRRVVFADMETGARLNLTNGDYKKVWIQWK